MNKYKFLAMLFCPEDGGRMALQNNLYLSTKLHGISTLLIS